MIVNRIGDFGLALGLFLIFTTFKTLDYDIIQVVASSYQNNANVFFCNINFDMMYLISILLLVGAVGKSAQIGLHT